MSQQRIMEDIHKDRLFNGENCLLQKLLRNNAEAEEWPSGFMEATQLAKKGEFANFLCPKSYDFHDSVINAPILLALSAVMELSALKLNNPDLMSEFKGSQDFDHDWFSEAFDLTVARCLATGLIHIKRES